MLLNKFRLPGASSSNPSSKAFDLAYQRLVVVHEYKALDAERILTPQVNRQKIAELMSLDQVISHKVKSSTLLQDLTAYYQAEPDVQKKMSQAVFDSPELKSCVLADKTLEEKYIDLSAYYIQHFSTMSVTDIIKAGYTAGQRNDLATAITHALPNDNPHRRMFDQFHQLGASLRAVKARVEKAKTEGVFDHVFLQTQQENLDRVSPQIHFLHTPEDESASRLSVLFVKVILALGSEAHQDLVADFENDIRVLADGASSFKQQHDLIKCLKEKLNLRKTFSEDLRFHLMSLVDEMYWQTNIPDDADALKALEVISHLRAKLIEYHALHMPNIPANQRRMSIGRTVNKLVHVDAALQLLNQFFKDLRENKLQAARLMQPGGEHVSDLEHVKTLHQLIYWIKIKMPLTSSLYRELVNTYELSIKQPLCEDWVDLAPVPLHSVSITLPTPSGPGEVLWVMVLNDFSPSKCMQTIDRLVFEYGGIQDGEEAKLIISKIHANLPLNFHEQIESLCTRLGMVTVDDVLGVLNPLVKYGSTMRLLLANSIPNNADDYLGLKKIIQDMHARAMLRQHELLMYRASQLYEASNQSPEIMDTMLHILSEMVPYSQAGYSENAKLSENETVSDSVYEWCVSLALDADEHRLDDILNRLESGAVEPLPKISDLRVLTAKLNTHQHSGLSVSTKLSIMVKIPNQFEDNSLNNKNNFYIS